MKAKGYRRSAEQCKCKWKNLVNRYKGKETSEPDNGRQCPFFEELDAIFKERERNMDRLLLESKAEEANNLSAERFLGIVWSFKTLKEFDIGLWPSLEKMLVPFYKLLERLPNLERLEVRCMSIRELARDPVPARLSIPLINLQFLGVDLVQLDDREIAVVGCLLRSTPALKIMDFSLPEEYAKTQYIKFLERISGEHH